ncbi:hypothetical protein B0T18DRAFT_226695 [Schizothecium vesticola]|uniref:Uncharacterized protein n=1 Tax=Schizothecium vesticola TaxID=314040 RepID=A0AA40K085_9PEZI|nr:hypothetical protein B0T18DRAFT_226695 [Schizothecium vesticola]
MAAPSRNGIPSLVIRGHSEVPSMGQAADHPSGPRKPSTTTIQDPRRDGVSLSLRDARGRLTGDWKDPSLSPGRPLGRFGVSPSRGSLAGPRVGCVRARNKVLMEEPWGANTSGGGCRLGHRRSGHAHAVNFGGGGFCRLHGSPQGKMGVARRTWNPGASRHKGPGVKRWSGGVKVGASQFVLGRLGKNRSKKGRL